MRQEYRYFLILGTWVALWTFFPLVALFAFIFESCRHFCLLRVRSKRRRAAEPYRKFDERWLEMEGFTVKEQLDDPADWWKK